MLLLVPLGDVLDRRRFVPIMLLASAAGTALCCFALIVWALGRRGPLVIRVAPTENAIQGAWPVGHAP
ncbi:hypothetical protein ACFYP0_31815 [Micromonospora arida]|uniref:hypothetical protein n=1 Tax=Micromonospora arida TaxID=2203715 RepID=UPI00369DE789